MSLYLCMVVSSLVAIACAPALTSLAPWRRRRGLSSVFPASEPIFDIQSIESRVRQTRVAVREVDPRQRRLVEVSKIAGETVDTLSVYLKSVDDSALPDFRPGQHIIVERPSSVGVPSISRCYTLSCGPRQKPWRITVRRAPNQEETKSVSAWIHRELRVGDRLRIRGPRGAFTLDKADSQKPIVFLAAGVGITPMASMLHDELSYSRSRSKWLFYQVRDWGAAPLLHELVSLVERSQNCRAWIAASRDVAPSESPMKHVRLFPGRLSVETMLDAIGTTDFSLYLCGGSEWTLTMRQRMVALGVPDHQIFDEIFEAPETPAIPRASHSADSAANATQWNVTFESSGTNATFCGDKGNLLSMAKEHSIHIPASCRTGNCGTCAVKLLRGTVKYLREPQAEIIDGEILPCVCIPTSDIGLQV